MTLAAEHSPVSSPDLATVGSCAAADIAVVRRRNGWSVVSPEGAERVADLVEGMCLADLVTEQFGGSVDPDRSARRSARGPAPSPDTAADPRDARLAALERTVAQLEHALAARVSTERAIGVLAERHATTPREAFESLRQSARSQGRAVVELAREVLDTLSGVSTPQPDAAPDAARPPAARPGAVAAHRPDARVRTAPDGRS